ncbi:MAG: hypothetical protein HIU92_16460 [Proteobacteria bacterium]|nr:hypothetical protein [Pseudomonadota bacterium]
MKVPLTGDTTLMDALAVKLAGVDASGVQGFSMLTPNAPMPQIRERFLLHVWMGFYRHGFTQAEPDETLMRTAIYAGVPAANTALAESGKLTHEIGQASGETHHG